MFPLILTRQRTAGAKGDACEGLAANSHRVAGSQVKVPAKLLG